MSRLHILTGDANNTFIVICHAPTPIGNNAAGVAWNTAVANALKPVTRMSVGNGPGQITTAESNQIATGDVLEVSFQFIDDPSWSTPTRTAQLNLIATDAVARTQNELAAKLKWFGAVVS